MYFIIGGKRNKKNKPETKEISYLTRWVEWSGKVGGESGKRKNGFSVNTLSIIFYIGLTFIIMFYILKC